jgi:hypothetical protein
MALDDDPKLLQEVINALAMEFDSKCEERHRMGAVQYGPMKFLEAENNLFGMIGEELVDTANYAKYLFIRLNLMEATLNASGVDMSDSPLRRTAEHGVAFDSAGFVQAAEVSGFLPNDPRVQDHGQWSSGGAPN